MNDKPDPLSDPGPDGSSPAGSPAATPRAHSAGIGAAWEREVLEKLLGATLVEQRRARRWGIFFKLAFLAYLTPLLIAALGLWSSGMGMGKSAGAVRHTALVDVKGVIEVDGEASAEAINTALRSAFEDPRTAGVVVRLNTPGGSPVQAGMVHDEIRRLRGLRPELPVIAVIEEVCASGGYYIAAAADRIVVDKASMVGSIGVLMDGFGFTGAMDKLGVERRLLVAGRNKGFLDSFSPLTDEQRRLAQRMLDEVHQQFIEVVKAGRGERLKDSGEIFSGLVWTGARSIELGLADALGTVEGVARDEIKAETIIDFSAHENLAERLARRIGASAGQAMARAIGAVGPVPALR
jgi:protease-4